MVDKYIYLDYNATTPVDPRVLQAMLPAYNQSFGNPASEHVFGQEALSLVEHARNQVGQLIGGASQGIIFTSGATESCNIAIKGVTQALKSRGNHIIVSAIEHKAALESCRRLQASGYYLTVLSPGPKGSISSQQVQDAITNSTILVCVMAVNNVIGTINPVADIGDICNKHGVLFFCDATQAPGKIPIDVERMSIDLMACSAHKIYGPKGVGALYIRQKNPRIKLLPLFDGGGQEYGLRSGTLNVPGIVGFGKACEICKELMSSELIRIKVLRGKLEDGLSCRLPNIIINCRDLQRVANTSSISFRGIDTSALLKELRGIAASTGSACEGGGLETSYVLTAIGMNHEQARGTVRFSLGHFTTEEQIDIVVDQVARAVEKLSCV